ncbi:PASTA domain-containing protein [Planomonospora venezuelensis]|uniref:PASTA domain-containing protein n=1 Tax=Planomonospora venezuelensis TaxID=1999 RepID=A0A841D6U8_PLAVE|nr:hypothetical protein [Planomonospora venezuelensis]
MPLRAPLPAVLQAPPHAPPPGSSPAPGNPVTAMSALTIAGSVLAGVVIFLTGGSPPPPAGTRSVPPVFTPAPEGTAPPGGTPFPETGAPRTRAPASGADGAPSAPELIVPDVRGADGATAQDRLQSAGFYAISLVPATVGDPSGWRVTSQSPAPDARAVSTQPITLYLAEIPRF